MAQELSFDVAHLGHVELLTPKYDESLAFFTDVMGLEVVEEDGDSVLNPTLSRQMGWLLRKR
ncbi:hypothetical protein GCM10025857_10580 [Alicyclobacillus contaminans]|uniref:VOC family protein n=1 Tax=Alicyclobacillus contaminans TaxID=392016 RepID=UPI00040AF25C|nr:VOC family protein [Alicyclobacillus contaminans]GMA49701.1 hypothetical protein GCM10025857_10580 [Alicyclobacillus contaminans]